MRSLCIAVLCFALAPLSALAAFNECQGTDPPPVEPQDGCNAYHAYTYEFDTATLTCSSTELVCNATIKDIDVLRGRTWFVDNIQDFHGLGYRSNFFQVYNIQCPENTYLHLYLQYLDTEGAPVCTGEDFVRLSGVDFEEELYCGTLNDTLDSRLQNGGIGRIFTNGTARLEFCSNVNTDVRTGFAVRATCLDPLEWNLEGCFDYLFVRAWDPDFIYDNLDGNYDKPDTIVRPHKRSTEGTLEEEQIKAERAWKRLSRRKRFAIQIRIELGPMDNVTYTERAVTIFFANGTQRIFDNPAITRLFTFNELVGSRNYYINSGLVQMFQGPGVLFIYKNEAWLMYTIPNPEEFFLPVPEIHDRVTEIYDYIYRCYVRPYPVIVSTGFGGFPLPNDQALAKLDPRIRPAWSTGWVKEDIQGGICTRKTNTATAPIKESVFDRGIIDFCGPFSNACDLTLRTACREALLADPVNFFG